MSRSRPALPARALLVLAALLLAAAPAWPSPAPLAAGPVDQASAATSRLPETADAMAFQPRDVELVGQIGGLIQALAVQGSYAYLGVGPRLVILDVSSPAQPIAVGQTMPPPNLAVVVDVAVQGDYAYVTYDDRQLRVFRVAERTSPVEIGSYQVPGTPTSLGVVGLAVAGRYAYVAANPGLYVVDLADPAHPTGVGRFDVGAVRGGTMTRMDAAVAGYYAYVSAENSFNERAGLQIVDLTNPADPAPAGFVAIAGTVGRRPTVAGQYAYVVSGGGLHVVDVSDPRQPVEVSSLPRNNLRPAAAVGRYAYAAGPDGLYVYDVADPRHPTQVTLYETAWAAVTLAAAGSQLYVADSWRGLWVVDAADPARPGQLGLYRAVSSVAAIVVRDRYAYAATDDGLHVLDVADPSRPTDVGYYDRTPGPLLLAVDRSYVYLARQDRDVDVVDVRDPSHPVQASRFRADVSTRGIGAANQRLYAVGEARGGGALQVVDVANPAQPASAGLYEIPQRELRAVAAADSHAYVAAERSGLYVVDLADPANPRALSVVPGPSSEVALAAPYAYVAGGAGLRIVDVADPANPNEVALYRLEGARYVALADRYAFLLGNSRQGLRVIDIADPAHPTEVGSYPPTERVKGLAAAAGYAYIASADRGLYVVRFTGAPQR